MTAVVITAFMYFIFKNRIIRFLKSKGLTVANYKGKEILTGGGLLLLFPCNLAIVLLSIYKYDYTYAIYMLVTVSLGLSGLLDDVLGDSKAKGIKGHIKAFIKGDFSTGIVKALMGVSIGYLIALSQYTNQFSAVVDTIAFSLCINLVNLLDLRPGRAIKGSFTLFLILVILSGYQGLWMVLPLATALCFYIKGELAEEYMLGDTGSNLIGGILGLYLISVSTLSLKVIFTIFLIMIHVFAEFYSISKLVERVSLLRFIDQAGRRKEGKEAK